MGGSMEFGWNNEELSDEIDALSAEVRVLDALKSHGIEVVRVGETLSTAHERVVDLLNPLLRLMDERQNTRDTQDIVDDVPLLDEGHSIIYTSLQKDFTHIYLASRLSQCIEQREHLDTTAELAEILADTSTHQDLEPEEQIRFVQVIGSAAGSDALAQAAEYIQDTDDPIMQFKKGRVLHLLEQM